jgi:hypothetical protein
VIRSNRTVRFFQNSIVNVPQVHHLRTSPHPEHRAWENWSGKRFPKLYIIEILPKITVGASIAADPAIMERGMRKRGESGEKTKSSEETITAIE